MTNKITLKSEPAALPEASTSEPAWLASLRQQVGSLRFGVVQVVVHEGRVVQIERTEKTRFEPKYPVTPTPER